MLAASRMGAGGLKEVESDRGAAEEAEAARGGMLGTEGGVPTWAGEGIPC
jgi:hypothetical protein